MPSIGLVLSAGGAPGRAYHAGTLAGILDDTGWDARHASLVIGTSAGSSAAAYVRAGLSPGDDLARWFAPLGEITAHLHLQSRQWTPPPGFTRKRWDVETILGADPHWGHWRQAQGLDAAGEALLARATERLAADLTAYGTGPETFGLIHADLRLANLMVDGDRLTAIDFDDCGFGWWAYDLAAALSFIETDPRLPDLIAAWVEGYSRVAPLRPEDRAMIPSLIFLRRVLLTAWLATRADSDTAQALGGPDYTQGTLELAERYLTDGLAAFRPEV